MLSIFSHFIFGSSGLFSGQHGGTGSSSWKDKSLCFDLRPSSLELDHGEQLIACFFPIEDVKGNQDELGLLKVTNLRLIWICCEKKRVNLSIGWRTVSLIFEQNLRDHLGTSNASLCILTKYDSTKYEFVFNKMPAYAAETWAANKIHPDSHWGSLVRLKRLLTNDKTLVVSHLSPIYLDEPFDVVFKVWQCYKRTHLFRHCRSNLTHLLSTDPTQQSDGKLGEINTLAGEETLDVYTGISHSESRSVKYTGTLILTNVRLIWIDEILPLRNFSIPYIRIDSIKLRQNDRILVNIYDYLMTSSNQVELRALKTADCTQSKRTRLIFEQMQNLFSIYKSKPRFGPESCEECLNIMSHLKPTEYYLESLEESDDLTRTPMNSPMGSVPDSNGVYLIDSDNLEQQVASGRAVDQRPPDESIERAEDELANYGVKLNNYLKEQPIERDRELIYSNELGLAVERPANDVDLERIWRIDL